MDTGKNTYKLKLHIRSREEFCFSCVVHQNVVMYDLHMLSILTKNKIIDIIWLLCQFRDKSQIYHTNISICNLYSPKMC